MDVVDKSIVTGEFDGLDEVDGLPEEDMDSQFIHPERTLILNRLKLPSFIIPLLL